MENPNTAIDGILNMNNAPIAPVAATSTSSSGALGMSWTTWIIIIILLAILGFNIFFYLAEGTQFFADISRQFLAWFSRTFGWFAVDAVKQTVDVSALGLKTTADTIADTATSAVDSLAASIEQPHQQQRHQPQKPHLQQIGGAEARSSMGMNSLYSTTTQAPTFPSPIQNALNSVQQQQDEVEADDSFSAVQSNRSSSKGGFCYIGADRGTRTCVEVGPSDRCMSGDIFPTMDVCINPSLRA